MNRSNINLVGNTTLGENVGSGEGIYKDKILGNTLRYKSLSVTGTTMVITSDADNIYFSANTGGSSSGCALTGYTCINRTSLGIDSLPYGAGSGSLISIGSCNITGGSASSSIAIGDCALMHTSGFGNIAIGLQALMCNAGNNGNVGVGVQALCCNIGNFNTALGYKAMCDNAGGASNTAVGTNSLASNTSGNNNVGIGQNALGGNTTGCYNVGIGDQAVYGNGGGLNNIGIGRSALNNNTGSCNIGLGFNTLYNNTGSNNIAFGYGALCCNSSGSRNLAIGLSALFNNKTGSDGIAIGECALHDFSGTTSNIAIGKQSMARATALATYNVAIGGYSQCGTAIGQSVSFGNISLGYFSLKNLVAANYNIAIGYQSSDAITSGSTNVAIGVCSLQSVVLGSKNVAIGCRAGVTVTGSSNVLLGPAAGSGAIGDDNLYISNTTTNNLIIGCFSNNCICNGGNTTAWDTTSDCRIKECAETISNALSTISQLNPITFDYTCGFTGIRNWDEGKRIGNYGFLAQEFETVFPKYVGCSQGKIASGNTVSDFRTINTGHLVPILVKAIQELEARVQALES
jgi:trimeric autotransporter adhesin